MAASEEILRELQSMRLEQKKDHNEVMNKLKNIEENNSTLKTRTDKLESKVKTLDKDNRKRNVIIYGVAEKETESFEDLEKIISNVINTTMECNLRKEEIDDFFRLGKKTGNGNNRPRPILMKLISFWRKREIISKASKLKGTNIFLANDWSPEHSEELKKLRAEMKDLKNRGHTVKIRGLSLIVDGKPWKNADSMDVDQVVATPIQPTKANISEKQQKRQKSPEIINSLYKETNVEKSLIKKPKIFTNTHIRSSSLDQITLDNLGFKKTGNKQEEEKRNISYQHVIHTPPPVTKDHQQPGNSIPTKINDE
ncbi:hypothetical protein M8J76_007153 [Diaphorina citri]|nr:hypothetical protein M8J76_007153 [Diaphorina citri]